MQGYSSTYTYIYHFSSINSYLRRVDIIEEKGYNNHLKLIQKTHNATSSNRTDETTVIYIYKYILRHGKIYRLDSIKLEGKDIKKNTKLTMQKMHTVG